MSAQHNTSALLLTCAFKYFCRTGLICSSGMLQNHDVTRPDAQQTFRLMHYFSVEGKEFPEDFPRVGVLHSALCALPSALCPVRPTLCTLHSTLGTLHCHLTLPY